MGGGGGERGGAGRQERKKNMMEMNRHCGTTVCARVANLYQVKRFEVSP